MILHQKYLFLLQQNSSAQLQWLRTHDQFGSRKLINSKSVQSFQRWKTPICRGSSTSSNLRGFKSADIPSCRQQPSALGPRRQADLPSLKLTYQVAPENGRLEYFLVSFWGVAQPIFRGELSLRFRQRNLLFSQWFPLKPASVKICGKDGK